jgi:hypothetical protein
MVATLRQIAERKRVSYRAIKKRRDREVWTPAGKARVNHKEAEVFHVDALPSDLRDLFDSPTGTDLEIEVELYTRAPAWARKKADKYLRVLKASAGLRGDALRQFISTWNITHPEISTSYPRVIDARRIYRGEGISGLLSHHGKSAGQSIVRDDWFAYFKAAYLTEGAPSLRSCWLRTLGYAKGLDSSITAASFPSPRTFLRRLERDTPKNAIYLARHGREAWNRKYGTYIDRDYANLKPGECLVSDHAQVDVAVLLPSGKVCFPWVTAWRDFKSGKWLGWHHHSEPPNSDHIFQSFHRAVRDYGLPTDAYMDNGRDYRCRDFAGGRSHHRLSIDESRATTMLGLLGITPRFSLPRNAQAKTIERDFLKCKEWFSKHMPGYRGGNVQERPGKLNTEIKTGAILPWAEYQTLMNTFITGVLNRMPVNGKIHKGQSPDSLWASERTEARMVSPDALKLFCMRTSRSLTIGRNGVRDTEAGVTYWAEWMSGIKGERVYLRRDIKEYHEAWVFRAEDDEYLGKALIAERAEALARTPVEKAQLKALLARKRLHERTAKAFARIQDSPSPSEAIAHMQAGASLLLPDQPNAPRVRTIKHPPPMDAAILLDRAMQAEGLHDLRLIQPPEETMDRLYLYEADIPGMERDQQ